MKWRMKQLQVIENVQAHMDNSLKKWGLKFLWASHLHRRLIELRFLDVSARKSGVGTRNCISNMIPGDADIADPDTTV